MSISVETCRCGASVTTTYASDLSAFRKAHEPCRAAFIAAQTQKKES